MFTSNLTQVTLTNLVKRSLIFRKCSTYNTKMPAAAGKGSMYTKSNNISNGLCQMYGNEANIREITKTLKYK